MDSKKVIGYALAIAGLVVMAVGYGIVKLEIGFLSGLKSSYITGLALFLILAGVAIVSISSRGIKSSKRKEQQAEEEVPIYQGEGKNRKIVGYRRE